MEKVHRISDRRKYIEKRNEVKRVVREAKRKSWEEFGNMVESKARENNTRDFWKTVKAIRGKFGKRIRTIKEGGNLISNKEAVLQVWRKHYEDKFRKTEAEQIEGITFGPHKEVSNPETEGDIEEAEVIRSIDRMKTGKAAGPDGMAPTE